jgi:hypothetical protein
MRGCGYVFLKAIALDKLGSIRRLRRSIKTDCIKGTLGGALLTESSLPY